MMLKIYQVLKQQENVKEQDNVKLLTETTNVENIEEKLETPDPAQTTMIQPKSMSISRKRNTKQMAMLCVSQD